MPHDTSSSSESNSDDKSSDNESVNVQEANKSTPLYLNEIKIQPSASLIKINPNNHLSTLYVNLQPSNKIDVKRSKFDSLTKPLVTNNKQEEKKPKQSSDDQLIYKLKTKFLLKTRIEKI